MWKLVTITHTFKNGRRTVDPNGHEAMLKQISEKVSQVKGYTVIDSYIPCLNEKEEMKYSAGLIYIKLPISSKEDNMEIDISIKSIRAVKYVYTLNAKAERDLLKVKNAVKIEEIEFKKGDVVKIKIGDLADLEAIVIEPNCMIKNGEKFSKVLVTLFNSSEEQIINNNDLEILKNYIEEYSLNIY